MAADLRLRLGRCGIRYSDMKTGFLFVLFQ